MGETVSNLDTGRVIDIPAEKIAANTKNFYEKTELDALAASIELTGLLHPILVKPSVLSDSYVLIDGERRFRAMAEVLGWKTVPAIVRTPVNDILEELMLIEANRQQRKMSAADLSKQAERYTALLAELKDAGVEIPGRLRDAVAEAMQVSASKLARLAAIRSNSIPAVLEAFDDNEINESVAYELSKLPEDIQFKVFRQEMQRLGNDTLKVTANQVCKWADRYEAEAAAEQPAQNGKAQAGSNGKDEPPAPYTAFSPLWHETAEDEPPVRIPCGTELVFWGRNGLSRAPGGMVASYIENMPWCTLWWALIHGPTNVSESDTGDDAEEETE